MSADAKYLFLSDDWIAAARSLRAEYETQIPEAPVEVKVNVRVTEIPHRDDLLGHIDTSGGSLTIDEGHLNGSELDITLDYQTARAAFVSQDPQAVMQSFLMGKILVDGDVAQFFPLMQNLAPPANGEANRAGEVARRMAAFTADD